MNSVLAGLAPSGREVVVEIIGAADPALLAALRSDQTPTREQQEAAEEILYDEFSRRLGPGHEPTERGALISRTLAEFANWFIDHAY